MQKQTANLVDCLYSITGRSIGILDGKYVFIDTKEIVSKPILTQAKEQEANENETYRQEDINRVAGEEILKYFPVVKQLNYPRGSNQNDVVLTVGEKEITVGQMYSYIDDVREKSNLAIDNKKSLEEFIETLPKI